MRTGEFSGKIAKLRTNCEQPCHDIYGVYIVLPVEIETYQATEFLSAHSPGNRTVFGRFISKTGNKTGDLADMATAAIAGSESKQSRASGKQKLSRELVEKAGVALAMSEGFGALSIRNVAKILGVAPMALYTHVKNKDEMAEHVADALIGGVDVRTLGALTWQDRIRTLMRAHRDLIIKHPEITPYVAAATGEPRPGSQRFKQSVMGVLTQAGFTDDAAQDLYFTLVTYNYGSAVTAPGGSASSDSLLKYNEGLGTILMAFEDRMTRPALGLVESMRERLRFGRK